MKLSRRRALKTLLSGFGAVCASSAFPRPAAAAKRVRRLFVLIPTQAGLEVRAKGKARVDARPSQDQELISVKVDLTGVAPGTQLDVYAVNPTVSPDPALVGVLTLAQHPKKQNLVRGVLELKNYDGGTPPPEEVSPVSAITRFFVTAHNQPGAVVLDSLLNPGSGGSGGSEITLVPTVHGAETGTTGRSLKARTDDKQRFRVEVESTGLPNNTRVEVRFSHLDNGANLFAGQFLLLPKRGLVEFKVEWDTLDGPFPPGQAVPIDKILSVSIVRVSNGLVLLTGVF